MENRTWKKPGKRFFNRVGEVDLVGYMPVEFNGKPGGWTDGHLCFFTFIPEDGKGKKIRKGYEQSVTIDQYRCGKLVEKGSRLKFDNPLRYLTRVDDEEVKDGVAFFERMDGVKWSDWEYPVAINDGYLNAIMYYAQKMYGKKAEILFWLDCEWNDLYDRYGSGKEREVPILVTVNDEPFAALMPLVYDVKISQLKEDGFL